MEVPFLCPLGLEAGEVRLTGIDSFLGNVRATQAGEGRALAGLPGQGGSAWVLVKERSPLDCEPPED